MIELFTSKWANKTLAHLRCQPVGISRGTPRFPVPYRYRMARELVPSRETFGLEDREEFERAYVAGLERIGLEAIVGKLERIGRESGGAALVLLCFEREDQFCHRHLLRRWLRERGVEIRELKAGDLPQREDVAQRSLF